MGTIGIQSKQKKPDISDLLGFVISKVNWFSRGGGETRILVSAERPEMIGQLSALALLFVLTFGLNLIPAFARPTWMAVAFVGFEFPDTKPLGSNDHLV